MRKLFLIELFSGSHSVSRALKRCLRGSHLHIMSVDNDPSSKATILTDINKWDFKRGITRFLKDRKKGDLVCVHASPPCTHYSRARTTGGPRDLKGAGRNVKTAVKIIKFVRPDIWTLENPVGLLRHQHFMQKFAKYRNTTTYCKWGKPFKKPTDIWSNVKGLNLPQCTSETPCPHKARYGHHAMTAQSGSTSSGVPGSGGGKNVYPLPSRLVCHIYNKGLEQLAAKRSRGTRSPTR